MGDQTRPHVHTPPPGQRSAALLKRADEIMLGVSLIGRYRDGWFIEDVDGNRYLDWLNGWASAPLGGNHPEIVGDVRVIGAYMCLEFVEDKDTKEPAHDLTREIVYAMERRGVVPIYEPAFNYFRPTLALNQPPAPFALGCDIREECVAEVSEAHAKGVR